MKYLDKFLTNILSWKLWVFAVSFFALMHDKIDGVAWIGLAVALIGGRIAEYKWGGK